MPGWIALTWVRVICLVSPRRIAFSWQGQRAMAKLPAPPTPRRIWKSDKYWKEENGDESNLGFRGPAIGVFEWD